MRVASSLRLLFFLRVPFSRTIRCVAGAESRHRFYQLSRHMGIEPFNRLCKVVRSGDIMTLLKTGHN